MTERVAVQEEAVKQVCRFCGSDRLVNALYYWKANTHHGTFDASGFAIGPGTAAGVLADGKSLTQSVQAKELTPAEPQLVSDMMIGFIFLALLVAGGVVMSFGGAMAIAAGVAIWAVDLVLIVKIVNSNSRKTRKWKQAVESLGEKALCENCGKLNE